MSDAEITSSASLTTILSDVQSVMVIGIFSFRVMRQRMVPSHSSILSDAEGASRVCYGSIMTDNRAMNSLKNSHISIASDAEMVNVVCYSKNDE